MFFNRQYYTHNNICVPTVKRTYVWQNVVDTLDMNEYYGVVNTKCTKRLLTSIWYACFGTTFWLVRRSSWAISLGPPGQRMKGICACWTSLRAVKSDCAWMMCVAFSSWVESGSGTDVQCVGCPKVHRHNLRHKKNNITISSLFFL